jgi:hypothetical protein
VSQHVHVVQDRLAWIGFRVGSRRFTVARHKALAMIGVETQYTWTRYLDAAQIAERNRTAPVGALHRAGDWYVVRQLLPLEGLTWATLGRVIAAMTAWADVARPRPPRDVDVCRLFASFSA